MTTQTELFEVGERTPQPRPLAKFPTPADPGSGPAGETCGSCRHKIATGHGRVYLKCGLMREAWTHGPGTDIRARWAACSQWQQRETRNA